MDGRIALLGRPRIERRDGAMPLAGTLDHRELLADAEREIGYVARTADLLTEAVACCRRLSDVYKWAGAVALTDLLELDPAPNDAETAHGRSAWRPRARCRTCTSGCGTAPGSKRPPGGR